MKKILSVLLAVTMTAVLFIGLASAEEGEKVVVSFYMSTDMEVTATPIVEAYNASQDEVEVQATFIPEDDYDDKMLVLATGDSDIDVFWIRSPSQAKKYMGYDVLVDLKPFAEASGLDTSSIDATLAAISDEDGGFYGLPISSSCWMLFYNKDLFDAKGLDYPIDLTWEEYADLAAELTYEEDGVKYWGGINPNWTPNLGAIPMGEYLDDSEPLEKTMEYMEILYRCYVTDASHPSIAEMSTGTFDINAYWGNGNIYMMINGDWEFRLLDVDFEYGAAPLPVLDEEMTGYSCGQCNVLSIYVGSTKQQESYDFIEYYTTSVEGTSVISENGEVPTYATDEAMAVYQESVTVPGVEYRFSSSILNEQGTADYYAEILDVFADEMELYLLDEQSLEDAFANYYELRDEIISEY